MPDLRFGMKIITAVKNHEPLKDEELDFIYDCFEMNVSKTELSTLYFIAGYVSRKEGLCNDMNYKQPLNSKCRQFTIELLR